MFIMCFYVILVTHFKGNRYLMFIDSKLQYFSTLTEPPQLKNPIAFEIAFNHNNTNLVVL